MDFCGIFSGPWNLFVKDRFPLNPGSVKDRFHCTILKDVFGEIVWNGKCK
jgi:hypothetical protein